MPKGQVTRDFIIAKAAPLFNEKGYSGSSIADVMLATGLKKGGIYNHFESKDELAVAAFEHNWGLLKVRYAQALHAAGASPTAQLFAAIDVHAGFAEGEPVVGGCPLLNTAVESDDGHPLLRERVRKAVDFWRELLSNIVNSGIAQGEFRTADADEIATIIISTLEGGVMLSKLYHSPDYLLRAAAHLRTFLNEKLLL